MSTENLPFESSNENVERRERIQAIEAINTGSEQKAQILMVLLGLKPAAELSIYPHNSAPDEVESLLDRTGLAYAKKEGELRGPEIAEYAISEDKAKVRQLLNGVTAAEYGLLMGYPQTAVDAFIKREKYEGALPEDIENSIFKFAFSKDHYQEEFETVRKWNKALEEYAPDLIR